MLQQRMRGAFGFETALHIRQPDALQPFLKLRRTLQSQRLAHIKCVMERCRLVVEHDVVGTRNTHNEVHTSRPKQCQQNIHVVLIGFRVVGITNVATHRDAEQLAAEVVLKPRTDDLFAVVEILGSNKPDDGIDEQWLEFSGDCIGPRLQVSADRRRGAHRPKARNLAPFQST